MCLQFLKVVKKPNNEQMKGIQENCKKLNVGNYYFASHYQESSQSCLAPLWWKMNYNEKKQTKATGTVKCKTTKKSLTRRMESLQLIQSLQENFCTRTLPNNYVETVCGRPDAKKEF